MLSGRRQMHMLKVMVEWVCIIPFFSFSMVMNVDVTWATTSDLELRTFMDNVKRKNNK